MRILGRILTVLLFFTAPSTAEIKSRHIRSSNQSIIFLDEFMFTHNSYVSIAISSVSVTSPSQPDPSRLGFFLLRKRPFVPLEFEGQENPDFCIMNSKFSSVIFTFENLSSPPQSSFSQLHHVTHPGKYNLYFANCNPDTLVTMDVRTELYNIDNGITKDYLSAGQAQLPSLYYMISIIFPCFLGSWVLVCFKNQQSFHRIHLLIGWLLVMIAVNLTCVGNDTYNVKVTGIHQGGDVLFYNLQFFRVVLLFTVLIVTGWCLTKTNLRDWENQELDNHCWTIAISVRVMAKVTYQVIEDCFLLEDGMDDYWVLFMLLDKFLDYMIWWGVFMFPSLRSFGQGDDEVKHKKLIITLYCLMFGVCSMLPLVDMWVYNLAYEISSLVFYMLMFYIFRPVENQ